MLRLLVLVALVSACGEPREGSHADEQSHVASTAQAQAAPSKPGEAPKASAAPAAAAGASTGAGGHPALLDPALAVERAPDRFAVTLETTKGDIVIDVQRQWAPLGADRFYNLVKIGYFNDNAFFRVVAGFMAQVGLHGDPKVNRVWRRASIKDDPVTQQNLRGMVTFATSGRDSRVNQFYVNLVDNQRLDGMGFSPFGKVRDMAVVDKLYSGYGEGAPGGRGPSQGLIHARGNEYLRAQFPELDYIKRASVTTP